MTSNIGSHYLIENISQSGQLDERTRNRVLAELRAHFRPEFLNRIDEIVIFKPLTLEEIKKIIDLQLKQLRDRLADRRITIELTDAAKEHIAREGYDPVYGARPLRRFLQRHVETPIARKIIAGEIRDGMHVVVDFKDGQLTFEPVLQAEPVETTG